LTPLNNECTQPCSIVTEKRLKIGIIPKIIFGAQEAPILAGFERF
jgi:hypothetical protein